MLKMLGKIFFLEIKFFKITWKNKKWLVDKLKKNEGKSCWKMCGYVQYKTGNKKKNED